MTVKQILFTLFFLGAMGFFAHSVWRLIRLARLGKNISGLLESPVDRIGKVIYLVFFQRKVVQEAFGWNHVIIFWAFMIITVGHAEFILRGIFPSFSLAPLGPIYSAILFGGDFMAFLVLFAIAAALFRRIVVKPKHIHYDSAEGFLILSMISMVMITYFLATGFGIHGQHVDVFGHRESLIFSSVVAGWVSGVQTQSAHDIWYQVFWWSHAVVLFSFLNIIPHSKHIHLLGAVPNIFLHKRHKHKAALEPIKFEDETITQYGTGQFTDVTWKGLLDTYACTECGRCDLYCPANRTGKPLKPQQVIHDLRDNMKHNGGAILKDRKLTQFEGPPAEWQPLLPLIAASEEERKHGQTSPEVLFACTSCGACVNACPVMIDHVDTIMDMRRHLTLMEGNVSPQLTNTFKNIESNYNPWGIGHDQRTAWAEGLGLKYWAGSEDSDKFEYLFWVGCAGSYDARAQKTMKAFIRILDAAQIKYAVLGEKEQCTGDSARRAGNEYLFDAMAKTNVETLNSLGVKKVVTACPHCFNTLKNEYPAFGGNYEVLHHSQLISKLLDEGRIKVTEELVKKVTYHDPCFLGRWNDEVEAPRRSLAAVKRLQVVEMEESKQKSMCCGAGGAQMWMEEMHGTERINKKRTEQALAVSPDIIAVACPFCMTMIEDGVKSLEKEETVKVLDLAEVIAGAMEPSQSPPPQA